MESRGLAHRSVNVRITLRATAAWGQDAIRQGLPAPLALTSGRTPCASFWV